LHSPGCTGGNKDATATGPPRSSGGASSGGCTPDTAKAVTRTFIQTKGFDPPCAKAKRGSEFVFGNLDTKPHTVRAAKGAVGDAAAFAHQLDAEFRKKLPNDYRPVEAKLVVLPAGKAFLFSYVRTKKRTLNTLVIVPVPARSYVFNAISVPGDKEVAGDIGTILKSFKPVSGG